MADPVAGSSGFVDVSGFVKDIDAKSTKVNSMANAMNKAGEGAESKGTSLGEVFALQLAVQDLSRTASGAAEIASAMHSSASGMLQKLSR